MKISELPRPPKELGLELPGRELRHGIENFSHALEQGRAVVYRRNFDTCAYEYMGDYIAEITGYRAAEMTPEIWDRLIISVEFKGGLCGLTLEEANRRVRTGEIDRWQADVEIRTRSGANCWVMDLSTGLCDASGRCYGCLGILQDITERKLAERELVRTSAALREQKAQFEADLALAAELQAALLPTHLPHFPRHAGEGDIALRFHCRYQPTGMVGGDFFDVVPLSEEKAGVFICDVMGHGVRSALVTAMVRALIEQLSGEAEEPGLFLARINNSLRSILTRAQQPMFATAFYLVANVVSGDVCYASAGHPSPLLLRRAGGVEWVGAGGGSSGPVLGMLGEAQYSTTRLKAETGDVILLFTDGIIEVTDARDQEYGCERLLKAAQCTPGRSPADLLDAIMDDAKQFAAGHRFADDVCLAAVEFARVESRTLEGKP